MDCITFRTNDLLIEEFYRIRQNEAKEFAEKHRPVSLAIKSTVIPDKMPTSYLEWRKALNKEVKKNYYLSWLFH